MQGQVLGNRYRIIDQLGEGGMAFVYLAVDEKLGRKVAIKVLHEHMERNPDIRHRFHLEAQSISALDHPNIVKIYDFSGDKSHRLWIVTEVIRGKNLAQFVDQYTGGHLHPIVAACLVREICKALEKAHNHGIVHRDIKPENIMVTVNGRTKLMDFGIAKDLAKSGMTMTGTFMGSPSYMSPEQIRGRDVDLRSDLYSLSVLFYEIVTGRLPFVGTSTHDVVMKIMTGEYTFPKYLVDGLPDELNDMIMRGMSRDPVIRQQAAREYGIEIDQYLQNIGFDESHIELERYFKDRRSYDARLQRSDKTRIERRLSPRSTDLGTVGQQLQTPPKVDQRTSHAKAGGPSNSSSALALPRQTEGTPDLDLPLAPKRSNPSRQIAPNPSQKSYVIPDPTAAKPTEHPRGAPPAASTAKRGSTGAYSPKSRSSTSKHRRISKTAYHPDGAKESAGRSVSPARSSGERSAAAQSNALKSRVAQPSVAQSINIRSSIAHSRHSAELPSTSLPDVKAKSRKSPTSQSDQVEQVATGQSNSRVAGRRRPRRNSNGSGSGSRYPSGRRASAPYNSSKSRSREDRQRRLRHRRRTSYRPYTASVSNQWFGVLLISLFVALSVWGLMQARHHLRTMGWSPADLRLTDLGLLTAPESSKFAGNSTEKTRRIGSQSVNRSKSTTDLPSNSKQQSLTKTHGQPSPIINARRPASVVGEKPSTTSQTTKNESMNSTQQSISRLRPRKVYSQRDSNRTSPPTVNPSSLKTGRATTSKATRSGENIGLEPAHRRAQLQAGVDVKTSQISLYRTSSGRQARRPVTSDSVGRGSVAMTSSPASLIYKEGQRLGTTVDEFGNSREITLPAGQHVIELRRSGYQTQELEFTLRADQHLTLGPVRLQKDQDLAKIGLTFRVNRFPVEATVVDLSSNSTRFLELESPVYSLKLTAGSYQVQLVYQDQHQTRNFELSEKLGDLTFQANFE